MSVRIFNNAIHSVIKDVSQRSITKLWGLSVSEMSYFNFGYFSTKFGTSVDGHEEIIT
jgi:hypothetical protein